MVEMLCERGEKEGEGSLGMGPPVGERIGVVGVNAESNDVARIFRRPVAPVV
jgi:hypothetical protein